MRRITAISLLLSLCFLLLSSSVGAQSAVPTPPNPALYRLVEVTRGLSQPLLVTHAGDARLFIVGMRGSSLSKRPVASASSRTGRCCRLPSWISAASSAWAMNRACWAWRSIHSTPPMAGSSSTTRAAMVIRSSPVTPVPPATRMWPIPTAGNRSCSSTSPTATTTAGIWPSGEMASSTSAWAMVAPAAIRRTEPRIPMNSSVRCFASTSINCPTPSRPITRSSGAPAIGQRSGRWGYGTPGAGASTD